MVTKDEAKKELSKMIQVFRDNKDQYKLSTYKEAQVRKEFIDRLFELLDWDIDNKQGNSERFKEVISEDSIKIEGKTKAPDYCFRLGGQRIFFVEAKKPSVNLKMNPEPAYQLRRYAWNVSIPISILTDFEDFIIYDCRVKPNENDDASVARIMIIHFEDYLEQFDKIWDVFSKEAVMKGSFDKFIESKKGMQGTVEVDNSFLKEIEKWRDDLAKNLALRNSNLQISELNYSVQKIIDRILFLIICEYKSIERYGKLKELSEKTNIYKNLVPYFKDADAKYNSGIFDFTKDALTPQLIIDDKVLKEIIQNLYYPKSPYDFSVLPIEILGKVYEKFLGKTISLTSSHKAKIEEKPEVRKAGGVYYTPEYVVDYIVENTVGRMLKGKTPKQIEDIKILDSACGSGTFLVRAYTYILEYLLEYYEKNTTKHKKEIYQTKTGKWFLTTEVRKKVLLNNIYGVDIDPQAVEVTKLSLLLKVLENETKESVNQQLKLFRERALPNLDKNVKCGNSLVNSSYFSQKTLSSTSSDELSKISPFNWNKEFPFEFDIIIGNPPYVKEYTHRESFEIVKNTDMRKYYQGKMDLWYLFTCKALDLLKDSGLHSYIAQNNWITSAGASILRNKILSDSKIISFFDFNDFKVFKEAGIQTMIFVLEKAKTTNPYFVDYYRVINKSISKEELRNCLMTKKDGNKIERFRAKIIPKELINKTINFTDSQFNDILQQITSNSNHKFKDDDISTGIDVHQDFVNDKHLSVLKDGIIKKGDGIFNLSCEEYNRLKLTQKEKQIIKPFFTTEQLLRYYGNPKNKLWVIYSNMDVRKNIDDYPHIKEHLDKFKKVVTSDFKPYGLHRAREQRFFEGVKIISLRKTSKPLFTYTDFPCYVSQTYFVIKPKDMNMKYLVGLLNSNLIHFWLKFKGKKQGEQLQVDKAPLLELPLYKPKNKTENNIEDAIVKNVDLIIELTKKLESIKLDREREIIRKQIEALENQINWKICDLFGIGKERDVIEESLK